MLRGLFYWVKIMFIKKNKKTLKQRLITLAITLPFYALFFLIVSFHDCLSWNIIIPIAAAFALLLFVFNFFTMRRLHRKRLVFPADPQCYDYRFYKGIPFQILFSLSFFLIALVAPSVAFVYGFLIIDYWLLIFIEVILFCAFGIALVTMWFMAARFKLGFNAQGFYLDHDGGVFIEWKEVKEVKINYYGGRYLLISFIDEDGKKGEPIKIPSGYCSTSLTKLLRLFKEYTDGDTKNEK